MVKFLHEEMGFNILAFEADFFGVNKAWSDYVNGNKEYQNVLNQMYVFWSQLSNAREFISNDRRITRHQQPNHFGRF